MSVSLLRAYRESRSSDLLHIRAGLLLRTKGSAVSNLVHFIYSVNCCGATICYSNMFQLEEKKKQKSLLSNMFNIIGVATMIL